MTQYSLGLDTSTYQDDSHTPQHIDFSKPKLYNIRFFMNRIVFSNAKDQDIDINWIAQKQHNYIRGGYGFWDYRDGNPGVDAQANAMVNVMKPDKGEFPVAWMDFEQPNSSWPQLPSRDICLYSIERYMKLLEDGLGMESGIYTSPKFIKYLMSSYGRLIDLPKWLRDKPLWVAQWPWFPQFDTLPGESMEEYFIRAKKKPELYGQWDKWTLWQYGTPNYGYKYGMESEDVDVDFFNGTDEELYQFCGLIEKPDDPIEPPKPPETPEDELMKMKVISDTLRVRSAPNTNLDTVILRNEIKGKEITVYDIAGKDSAWVKVHPTQEEWMCVENNIRRYLQKI